MFDLEGKSAGTRANPALMPISRLRVDVGKSLPKVTELKELYSPGDEYMPKSRKPYTITKQRERWSEEEHTKFLEALKLYGRAWRRIEEHVGTKTAIQIRSHAQKFFSKVVRETGDDAGSEKSIEIPPPRPKRKPVHPYPRKLVHSRMKGTSIPKLLERSLSPADASSVSEQEKRSSTSALSAAGSDIIGSTASNPSAVCQSPVSSPVRSKLVGLLDAELEGGHSLSSSSTEEENGSSLDVPVDAGLGPLDILLLNDLILERGNKDNISTEEGSPAEVSTPRLKLFGKTVLVGDFHRPSCRNIPQGSKSLHHDDIGNHEESSDPNVHNSAPAAMEDTMQGYGSENSCKTTQNPWPYGVAPWSYNMQWLQEKSHSAEASMGLPWLAFYGNLPFPVTCSYNVTSREAPPGSCTETLDDKGTNKGGFCSASNTASIREMGVLEKENPFVNCLYGDMDKKPAASSQFKASKNSAFSSHRVTGSGNSGKGFVPYKRCIAERDMQQLHIAGNDRPEQRIRLCL